MKTEYITFYILFHNSKKVQNTRKRSEVKVLSYGGCRLHFRCIFLLLGTFLQFFFCCPYFQDSLSKYIKQNILTLPISSYCYNGKVCNLLTTKCSSNTRTWNTLSMNVVTPNLNLDENRVIELLYFCIFSFLVDNRQIFIVLNIW